jgi:hypothetical protein
MKYFAMALGFALAACGGGGGSGEPLISGSVSGSYDGNGFTVDAGFVAAAAEGGFAIGLGDGSLDCDSINDDAPPSGSFAVAFVDSIAVGTYSDVFVNIFRNVDGLHGYGTGGGTVMITGSNATSVAGSIDWAATNSETGEMHSITGTFEVVNCDGG